MHASAVDAWSTHIINMLVEMDVVFVANDSTTSQGKKSENKETTCDVRVESVKKTLHHHHTEAVEFTVGRCTSPAVTPKHHSNAKLVLLKWSLIF